MVQKIFNKVAQKMSKTMMIAVLVVGIALFSFNACTAANERWEYKIVRDASNLFSGSGLSGTGYHLQNTFNDLGAERWQLVLYCPQRGAFIFKRRR